METEKGKAAAMKARYRQAMKGKLTDLPPEESSAVRVFFSSTFTDMTVERNLLMREAVPHLRDYCKSRNLDFQVVDMRWGVREDASVEHTTTDMCLEEIVNCQRESAGPNFVAFLGDRYGSRLLPTTVHVTEYRTLRRLASWMERKEWEVVDKWYVVDTNSVPAVYRIQPITAVLPHYNDVDPKNRIVHQEHQQTWQRDQEKMLRVFKIVSDVAFNKRMITKEEYKKYYTSVTHQEVIVGLLNNPDLANRNVNTVLSFHRNLFDIDFQDKVAKRFIELTEEGTVDKEAAELRQQLRDELVKPYLDESCISEYSASWAAEKGVDPEDPDHQAYLHTFCDTFTAKMTTMIDTCTQGRDVVPTHTEEMYREVVAHLRFCREKCRNFCGREELLHSLHTLLNKVHTLDPEVKDIAKKIQEMAEGEDGEGWIAEEEEENVQTLNEIATDQAEQDAARSQEQQRLLDMSALTGATFAYGDAFDDDDADPKRDVKEENLAMPKIERFKRPVIIHGRGGSGKTALMARIAQLSSRWIPGSLLIVRFMGTTASSTGIRDVIMSVVEQIHYLYGIRAPAGLDLNVDFFYLVMYFHALLWRIDSHETPLYILLDSVDQLSNADYSHMMLWMPKMVPAGVHFIVSLATDHPEASNCLANAKERVPFDEQFVELGPLDQTSADKMVKSICHEAGRTLTAPQRTLVLQTYTNSGQALHLKLITEQALSWRSHYKVSDLVLANTLDGAVEQLFDQLEKEHGQMLVARTLGYLTLAKSGLTDGEIEDLLSLDDDVLQDTYIYHLPPDPEVIRLPSSLWVQVKSDLASYLAKQQAGDRQVNVWYHRHFREVADKRYATEEMAPKLHRAMAEYFLGTWSTQAKPLELFKGKTGSYEDCLRGVPAQPLTFDGFNKVLYNQRKLLELPHHLACSRSLEDFHTHIACNANFMVAVCQCFGVGVLMQQLAAMLAQYSGDGETGDEEVTQMVKDVEQVRGMLRLGIDDIRRDPSNLPTQILGQLGPQYIGSPGMTGLVQQCLQYVTTTSQALLVPYNAFVPSTGSLLLSSVNVRIFIMGSDSRVQQSCLCVDESKHCLYVTEWNPRGQMDNILVMDYEDGGGCMAQEKMPFFIHSMQFAAGKRFIVLKVYRKLDKWNPMYMYILYEGGLGTLPYKFDKIVTSISVSSHGKLVAFAYEKDKTVYIGNPDSKKRKIVVKQHVAMEKDVHIVLFSPDFSQLVAVDYIDNISVYNVQQKQLVSLHTSTDREAFSSWMKPKGLEAYHITNENLLLRVLKGEGMDDPNSIAVTDLVTRQEKHRLVSDKLLYEYNILQLDGREEFVLAAHQGHGITNGNVNFFGLIWRLSDGQQTTTITAFKSWEAACLIGEETLYCIGAWGSHGVINILSCGPRENPFPEGQLMVELKDHTKTILFLQPIQDNKCLVSGAEDNVIRFWDLERILRERHIDEEEGRSKKKKLKEVAEEDLSDVERLGRTTAFAVTGIADRRAYIGTDKGVVAFTPLHEDDASPVELVTLSDDLPPVHLMVLSKKGDYLMAAAKDIVAVFDARKGDLLYKMPGVRNRGTISCIAEGGNTAALCHGGMEGKVKLWDLKTGEVFKELEALYAFSVTEVNRGGTAVVGSFFEYPLVMNIFAQGDQFGDSIQMDKLDVMMSGLTCVCISPDDRLVAGCSADGCTRIVSSENVYLHRLQQRSNPTCAVFTYDSKQLVTGGYRTIYVWRMGTGQLDFKLSRHQDFVTCLRFARDHRFLLSSSLDRTVAVWDVKTRATVCMFRSQCQLHSFQLLPDLSRLAYVPDQAASIAVVRPNPTLQRVLDRGRKIEDMVDDPETLDVARSFATVFNTQKDNNKISSQACVIL